MGILANENAISSGGYQISNSLRFQAASSQYLARTPASTGSRQKTTYSFWIKRGTLTSLQRIMGASDNSTGDFIVNWTSGDAINIYDFTASGSVTNIDLTTTQVFRDPSAWYHIVYAIDTTQATASNRVKLYVNGSQVTAFSTATYPSLNANLYNNQASIPARIGIWPSGSQYLDGYIAEFNFIDGQALTPSSFGSTDPISGQWVAAKYTGTYGTNGFYLPFSNGTSTTTLGSDSSGNGNNWTLTNFTRSAGVSDCWMYDVPSGNGGASGTQPSSNYAVINPVGTSPAPIGTITQGNLNYSAAASANYSRALGTIGVSSGKWYWEMVVNSANRIQLGIIGINDYSLYYPGYSSVGYCYDQTTGNKVNNNTFTAYGATLTTNDIVGVAFDADAGTLTFYKNNVSQGTAFTGLSGTFVPAVGNGSSSASCSGIFNFGQRSFAYTPPSGFKALCTANLPVATIKQGNKYMDATTYSGNLVGQSITNAGSFKPDLVWVKSRSAATDNKLTDSVRGAQTALVSNSTAAETTDLTGVVSFNTNGFTLGTSTTYNNTGATYVGWQWQAGQGTTSSNTSGSITSTVSVNATAGFSVVTYTGNGSTSTVGHGLGVTPKMIIVKNRGDGGANWAVYHVSTGANAVLFLNSTAATTTVSGKWGTPNSTTFGVNTAADVNESGFNLVAYCFAEIAGFSKFGSYTGNGSGDGPFVYLGFRPKFFMWKRTDVASNPGWTIIDSTRNPYNYADLELNPNSSAVEGAGGASFNEDLLSNGLKFRNPGSGANANGGTYIYMAFAENPFAQANAR